MLRRQKEIDRGKWILEGYKIRPTTTEQLKLIRYSRDPPPHIWTGVWVHWSNVNGAHGLCKGEFQGDNDGIHHQVIQHRYREEQDKG